MLGDRHDMHVSYFSGLWYFSFTGFLIQHYFKTKPSRYQKLAQSWFHVGPPSSTPAQHSPSIGSTSRVYSYRLRTTVWSCYLLSLSERSILSSTHTILGGWALHRWTSQLITYSLCSIYRQCCSFFLNISLFFQKNVCIIYLEYMYYAF